MIVDWRRVADPRMADAYERERHRWLQDLGWDTRTGWQHVETARKSWGLPGLALLDGAEEVRAFTFFYDNGERLEFGGVFGAVDAGCVGLVDELVQVCREAGGRDLAGLQYMSSTAVVDILVEAGFTLQAVDYLSRSLTGPSGVVGTRPAGPVELRAWTSTDVDRVADLLHASYRPEAAGRFVRQHTPDAWRGYLDKLVQSEACGRVMFHHSRVAVDEQGTAGAVLVTELGPLTGHLPQVVVHPRCRNRGVGRALLDEAADSLHGAGYGCATLMVDVGNGAAQGLYRTSGFKPRGTFHAVTAAVGPQRGGSIRPQGGTIRSDRR